MATRTFAMPTISNEATELLTATDTAQLGPLIAHVERVSELTVQVLANMMYGQLASDKGKVTTYVGQLDALDKRVTAELHTTSLMNENESDEYDPSDWAHAVLELQARAEAMALPTGMPVGGCYSTVVVAAWLQSPLLWRTTGTTSAHATRR